MTALVVLWFVIQIIGWLWRMPVETARRMREQRAFNQLEKGLLALTEGDWSAAEKALEKSASVQGKTTAHYLAAAQAALNAEDQKPAAKPKKKAMKASAKTKTHARRVGAPISKAKPKAKARPRNTKARR